MDNKLQCLRCGDDYKPPQTTMFALLDIHGDVKGEYPAELFCCIKCGHI